SGWPVWPASKASNASSPPPAPARATCSKRPRKPRRRPGNDADPLAFAPLPTTAPPLSTPAPPPSTAPRRRGPSALAWLVALLLLAGGGWFGWQWLQARVQHERSVETRAAEHASALEQRIGALQQEQRAQAKRLQQAETTNRLLRDELLGIGQRAALLEDSVSQLADPERNSAQALRL